MSFKAFPIQVYVKLMAAILLPLTTQMTRFEQFSKALIYQPYIPNMEALGLMVHEEKIFEDLILKIYF